MSNTGTIKKMLNMAAIGTSYAAQKAAPSLAGKVLIAAGLQSTPLIVAADPYILTGITVAKIGVSVYEFFTE